MKRSEMIKKINCIIENYLQKPDPKYEILSTFILCKIEQAGMLPPAKEGRVTVQGNNEDGSIIIPIWGWEDENN